MTLRQIEQVAFAIHRDYAPHLDHADQPVHQLLSRGLAAMAVRVLTGCDPAAAAATVVDGQRDGGLDAIAIDPATNTLILVQAKWRAMGDKALNQGEARSFLDGVRNLRASRFDDFNRRVRDLAPTITRILHSPGARIVLAIAVTSDVNLDPSVLAIFKQEIDESNRASDMARFEHLKLDDLHRQVVNDLDPPGPTVTAHLIEWGVLSEPYRALHGRIRASELGRWYEQHGDHLFDSNIRREIEDSAVNHSILHTLLDQPEHFWYFNNGITVLCTDWPHALGYEVNSKTRQFRFENVSVVNGAQTVANIHKAMQVSPEAVDRAQVQIRFLALRDCPEGFGARVTYATNFQNSVDSRDFLALDPEQDRLRRDFKLDLNKTYVLRRTDPTPDRAVGCTVVEAVLAQACAQADLKFALAAKKNLSDLWQTTESDVYRQLFHKGVEAVDVWRRVQTVREVNDALTEFAMTGQETVMETAIEGDRIIAHLVLRLIEQADIEQPTSHQVKAWTHEVLLRLSKLVEQQSRGSRRRRIFHDLRRCRELVKHIFEVFDLDVSRSAPDTTRNLYDGIIEPEFQLQGRLGCRARGFRFTKDRFLVLAGPCSP